MSKERAARRSNAGSKSVGRWHSVKTEEITEAFVKWGIVGEPRERRVRVVRLAHFDKGPGVAL
jgi:hypothetical protein